jgi:hypothetical protein
VTTTGGEPPRRTGVPIPRTGVPRTGVPRTGVPPSVRTGGTAAKRVPAAPRRSRRFLRPLRTLAVTVGIVAFAGAVLAGLLYVRLLHGPISVAFLTQPIERAIAEEMSGLRVAIEGVDLRVAEGGQVEFELKNVRVTDSGGVPLVIAPSASVSLSRKALLRARIAPESVELISPRLSLFYSDDGVLALKFAPPTVPSESERAKLPSGRGSPETLPGSGAPVEADGALGRIDLVKVLSESSARARRREHAGAYLREIGLRSATVVIDQGGRQSIWSVSELGVDLDHRRSRSQIAGRAKVESAAGPFALNFRTFEQVATNTLQLAVSIQGLVPRGLARTLPPLAVLEGLDVPVWGDARLDLSNTGEILSGTISIDAAPGQVLLPWLTATPIKIDGGHLSLSYSRAARRFDLAPSVLVWGDSRMQFTGNIAHTQQGPGGPGWAFELKSAGGWLGAEPPLLQRLEIDDWSAQGFASPERGRVVLSHFQLRAGGAEVSAEGDVTDMAGAMEARLDGKIGPMPLSIFKTLWPAPLAPRTRDWVVKRVVRGWLQGGSFRLATDTGATGSGWAATPAPERASLTLQGANLGFNIVDSWPVLEVPRALLRLDEATLEMTVPEASFAVADGRRLGLKGTFTVDMKEPLPRTGHIAFRGQGPLSVALEMLDGEPFQLLQKGGLNPAGIEGKVDAQLAVALPLGRPLEPRDLKIDGRTRITEARLGHVLGPYEVHGGNIVLDMTPTAAEAKGEMLVNGVVAKASWQHVLGAPADKQPPLRITTVLDNSYRTQLGLDINDLVQGDVGVEVTVGRDGHGERRVHLRADLVNAELLLDSVAWHKPKGKPSTFEFDVIKGGHSHPIELMNVRLVGDDVAIEGWMGIGADNRVKEFRFPNFSLNVVTSLETHGKMRPDGIWEVTAKGPTYDGRDLFRAFFDVGKFDQGAKVRPGLDLRAEVETVVGYSDTTLRKVRMTLQKRANKLTGLDVRGILEGGKPFVAILQPEPGKSRRLRAESLDAGQLFKLVGFYPNAVGGLMTLDVNLDGDGPAERVGTLWARDFLILGDPIIAEVLQNADGSVQPGSRRTVMREQFEFEIMRVPFEVGHGQFVMHEAALRGVLVSAHMSGKVDFRRQSLDIGGTYVPMSGLMRVPAEIPIFGPLLTGPRGEGLFGITFGIKGSMERPQVIVNPLSLITPGIFREVFQMAPEDLRIIPRERPAAPRKDGSRASSAPAATPPGAGAIVPGVTPEVGGGWSAEAGQPPQPKRR